MGRNGSEKSALDARLSGYSAAATVATAARRLRSRTGNWPIYAAAAGSALAMTTGASAAGIVSGVYAVGGGPRGGVSVQPGLSTHSSIQGANFGPGEVHIKAFSAGLGASRIVQLSVQRALEFNFFQAGSYGQYVKNFAAGAAISSGAGPLASNTARIVKAFFSGHAYGSFVAGQPGFLGFAVGVGGGNFDYGWLKLEFINEPDTQVPQILAALAWGIQTTPNLAIAAGDTGTPEPGTMALGILAAGAAGVMALRRRRLAAQ